MGESSALIFLDSFKYDNFVITLWEMHGVIGIIGRDFFSLDFGAKLFILGFQLNYMTVVVQW